MVAPVPSVVSSGPPFWLPYESGLVLVGAVGLLVQAGQGWVRRMGGINTSPTIEYFMVLTNKVTAPINGDGVRASVRLPPQLASSLQAVPPTLDFPDPKLFPLGIGIALSATPQIVTLGTNVAFFWGDYR